MGLRGQRLQVKQPGHQGQQDSASEGNQEGKDHASGSSWFASQDSPRSMAAKITDLS